MERMDISIDWTWVERELFSSERIPHQEDAPAITSGAREALKRARALCKPLYVYAERKIASLQPGIIELDGGIGLSTKYVSSHIKGASRIGVFLVTIGSPLEEAASALMKRNEHLEGYMLDRIGSFAVEALARSFEEVLRRDRQLDKESVSIRFSPGYCDWPVEEQPKLDKLADFSAAGVRLTESHMMVPKKSISAIVAIGPEGLFLPDKNSPCSVCNKKDCDYKR